MGSMMLLIDGDWIWRFLYEVYRISVCVLLMLVIENLLTLAHTYEHAAWVQHRFSLVHPADSE